MLANDVLRERHQWFDVLLCYSPHILSEASLMPQQAFPPFGSARVWLAEKPPPTTR